MGLINLFGVQATEMSRRGFLTALGTLAAASVVGCGENNPSTRLDGGGGTGGTDGGMDAGVPTNFQLEANYATLPSHYPSSLHYYAERLLGVGTTGGGEVGDRNHLFSFDPNSSARPILSSLFFELPVSPGRFLNHLGKRPSGTKAVLTTNDGYYELSVGTSPTQRFIAFPSGNNFGGGAVYAGEKLFVAAANATVNGDGTTTFGTGRILVYPLSPSGVAQESGVQTIAVTGKNPTGLALWNPSTLVVLNSGPFGTGARASLDLIDIVSQTVTRTIDLGSFTAQVSAELAVTANGLAVIGSADGSGRLTFVDLNTGSLNPTTLPSTQFHSSLKIDEDLGLVYVTDFSPGSVTILNLATRAVIRSLMLSSGEAGPSELVDGRLIQSLPYGAALVYPV